MHQLTRRRLIAAAGASLAWATGARAQPAIKRPQFVYVLRVVPRLHDPKAWTEQDNAVVAKHFERLAKATEAGQVILAGRSAEALDKTFGIVVFEAENDAAAREFMLADPVVAGGLLTATLHPYAVALMRKP